MVVVKEGIFKYAIDLGDDIWIFKVNIQSGRKELLSAGRDESEGSRKTYGDPVWEVVRQVPNCVSVDSSHHE